MPRKSKNATEEEVEKVEEKVDVRQQQLELAKKAIAKKYGEVVTTLKDHEDMRIPTISTGCLSLDLALGNGGIARGRIYEIFGPNSGGKTTLAVNILIQAQRRGLKGLLVDAEHTADPTLFKGYGANIAELDIVQGYDGEANLDILEHLIKTGCYGVAVVDSVSALIPRSEAESNIDKDHMALLARLMSKASRKITPIANQTETTVIFINQLRMKIGTYGNPETTTGGEALPFYTTGRISVRGPEAKSRRIVDDTIGEVIGHKTLFEVIKNKLAAPFKTAEVNLIYGKGYDAHWEILDMATSLGIIDKKGSWYKYKDEAFAQGEFSTVAFLKAPENLEMYKEIRNEVINQIGLAKAYESHGSPGALFA